MIMKPVKHLKVNLILTEHMYLPVVKEGKFIYSVWELSDKEIETLIQNKQIVIRQSGIKVEAGKRSSPKQLYSDIDPFVSQMYFKNEEQLN